LSDATVYKIQSCSLMNMRCAGSWVSDASWRHTWPLLTLWDWAMLLTSDEWRKILHACVNQKGGHFEHLL